MGPRSSRPEPGRRGILAGLFSACLLGLGAFSPSLEAGSGSQGFALSRLDPALPGVTEQRVLEGDFEQHFQPIPAGEIRLAGGSGEHWLRLDFGRLASDESFSLALPRVPAELIELIVPAGEGWRRIRHSFFEADADSAPLGAMSNFPLGAAQDLPDHGYLRVLSAVPVMISPALLSTEEAARRDRSSAMVFVAAYTALFVLLLVNLMLFFALRERIYRDASLWALAVLLWLLARSGHLFTLPVLGLLGWWRSGAMAIFGFLMAAATMSFVRRYTDARRLGQEVDRLLLGSIFTLLALAGIGFVLPPAHARSLLLLSDLALTLSFAALLILTAAMWKRGYRRGRIGFAVLLLLAPSAWLSTVHLASHLGAAIRLDFLVPLSFALGVLLFSVALVERVIEFRIETARAREESERLGASLRREMALRRFRESTRAQLLQAAQSDAEWLAYRRLLAELRGLLPQRALFVHATGSDGSEVWVSDPQAEQASFKDLVRERIEKLRAVGRSRAPVEARFERRPAGEQAPQQFSYAIVPLPLKRPAWGVVMAEREAGESFGREELAILQEFAALAVELVGETRSQVELKREADTDVLTGVLNRRAGDAALAEAVRRTTLKRIPLTVAMVDLDHLRALNELHGHGVGDRCLAAVAELIAAHLSGDDAVVRYGGEEFLVIMPGRNLVQARELSESIRNAVEAAEIESEGRRIKLTVSIGLAQRQAEDSDASLVQRAEAALARAKALGRNRVITAQQGPAPRPVPGLY